MKTVLTVLALGWLTAASCAWAQDDPHAGHHPPAAGQATDGAAGQTEGHDPAADGGQHEHGKAGGKLQENMQRMQALMVRMRETTDPTQRRALLGEHLQVMRDQVKLMLAQAGGHAHGGQAGAGAAEAAQEAHGAQPSQSSEAGKKKKCAMMEGGKCKMMEDKKGGMMADEMMGSGMMMMHQKTEQRVHMLEQLLEQMVEREAVEHELESR
ncbi:MAG TPA: hypothetical protein VD791_10445 [Burkholderiales bacterium]|nr:hypothetical protein [Burkholderiales bacterium]